MPDTAWWVSERLRSAWRRGLFEGLPEVVSFVFPPGRPFRPTGFFSPKAGAGAERSPGRAPRGPNDGSPYTACCVQVRARLPAACGAGEGDGRRGRSVGPDGDLTRRTPPTPSQAAPPITHTPPAQSRADGSRTVPASISIRRSEQALAGRWSDVGPPTTQNQLHELQTGVLAKAVGIHRVRRVPRSHDKAT